MATASLSTVLLSTKLLTFTEEERNVKFEYMIDFEKRYMYTLDELEIFSKVNKSIMGGRPSQNLLATKKFDFFESRSGDLSYTDETFPRWMTMVKSFNVLDRTQQFIYHSPVRNFVWTWVDYFFGNLFSSWVRLFEPFRNSWPLSTNYGDSAEDDYHQFVTNTFDRTDSTYLRWEAAIISRFRPPIRKVYSLFVYLALSPILILLRIILPRRIRLGWIIPALLKVPYDRLEGASKYYEFFDSKQVLEDGSFEWLDHLTRDSIKTNVDLKLPVHILKAYLGLRFTIRGESRSSTANRLALFPKDTFDECVAGMRQPEKSADLMGQANVMDDWIVGDAWAGYDNYGGYPWLTTGQRRFYIDKALVPLCFIIMVVIGSFFYFNYGAWSEWDAIKFDIFDDYELKFIGGEPGYASSDRSNFYEDMPIHLHPSMLKAINIDVPTWSDNQNLFTDSPFYQYDSFFAI